MDTNVFLFVPNLIGYARIIFSLVSFYYMATDYFTAVWCYLFSAFLDVFDGYFARKLNQSTQFGAMLDQLTDRCSTMCLLVVLSSFYPQYMFWFQASMAIDIAGHWIHLHTSVVQGKTSHKYIDPSGNPIMHLYYTSKPVLFCMCAGNELFYCMLYLMHFNEGPFIPAVNMGLIPFLALLFAPVAILKTAITILHMMIASYNLGSIDIAERKAEAIKQREKRFS